MNGVPLPGLIQSECAYLGHSGEEVGLVGRIRCGGRCTHECRKDRNPASGPIGWRAKRDWQAVYVPQSRLFESQVGLRPQLQGAAYPAPQMAGLALNMETLPLLRVW